MAKTFAEATAEYYELDQTVKKCNELKEDLKAGIVKYMEKKNTKELKTNGFKVTLTYKEKRTILETEIINKYSMKDIVQMSKLSKPSIKKFMPEKDYDKYCTLGKPTIALAVNKR